METVQNTLPFNFYEPTDAAVSCSAYLKKDRFPQISN